VSDVEVVVVAEYDTLLVAGAVVVEYVGVVVVVDYEVKSDMAVVDHQDAAEEPLEPGHVNGQ
jgi:hypothetical protein